MDRTDWPRRGRATGHHELMMPLNEVTRATWETVSYEKNQPTSLRSAGKSYLDNLTNLARISKIPFRDSWLKVSKTMEPLLEYACMWPYLNVISSLLRNIFPLQHVSFCSHIYTYSKNYQ